jgi:CheY-like chemotaxis protein
LKASESLHRFDFTGFRVLVAEDHVVSQQSIARLLEKNGMTVDIVGSGREAVDRCRQTGYSMILMDCQMQDMDGYEATRKIREMEGDSGKRTPVIAITANAMAGDRDRCRQTTSGGRHNFSASVLRCRPKQGGEFGKCIQANFLSLLGIRRITTANLSAKQARHGAH